MPKSWTLPGGQGPVKLVLRSMGGAASAENDDAESDASSLVGKIPGWLRDPSLRPIVFSMYAAATGRKLDPARTTPADIQRIVVPGIEKTFLDGLVVIDTGKTSEKPEKSSEEEKTWTLPSLAGNLKL